MIRIVKSEERYFVDNESVNSYWLFSYSGYMDMKNTHFGDIKVFNDEALKAGKVFKPETVSDKEILTIVLEGELIHEDSTGCKEVLKAGDVQVLSAGEGVTFTGTNISEKDTHFCRMWIQPLRLNMEPTCRHKNFDAASCKNSLLPIASGQGFSDALKIRANATAYMAKLDQGEMVDLLTDLSRHVFIYVLEGEVTVCGQKLEEFDQVRINQNDTVVVQAETDAFFILVDAAGNS
ncbi:pirin family protein [Methanolobus psychrotolerans]|uniref:pirin family protein n=1 Tax=Methanolobus psychrotolerans TaxID=1874706 RepID=UPI000B9159C0|nr:pirin family protein [Methanolobus psychrotolerans]